MRQQHLYTFFLAVGTLTELSNAFGINAGTLNLIYMVGFFVLVFMRNRPAWIWWPGFLLIGLTSLIVLFLQVAGMFTPQLKMADGIISAAIYVRCLVFLQNYENNPPTAHKDEPENESESEPEN